MSFTAYILGLLTPLTAVCVLPLYPGFISYLASKKRDVSPLVLSLLITLGIILFMGLLGIIFTTIFQISLTTVTQIISPIAFSVLALVGFWMLVGKKISTRSFQLPQQKNPRFQALLYGFFFGAIVLPCNPGFIAAFFAQSLLFTSPLTSLLNFLFFGLGLATPLIVLAAVATAPKTKLVLSWLARHAGIINRFAGGIMLIISLYYLFFVFI